MLNITNTEVGERIISSNDDLEEFLSIIEDDDDNEVADDFDELVSFISDDDLI